MTNSAYRGTKRLKLHTEPYVTRIEFTKPKVGQATREGAVSASAYVELMEKNPARRKLLREARMQLGRQVSQYDDSGLKSLRLRAGMSQAELGRKAGMNQVQIARLESDRAANPTLDTIRKLSLALQISALEITKALLDQGGRPYCDGSDARGKSKPTKYLVDFAASFLGGPSISIKYSDKTT